MPEGEGSDLGITWYVERYHGDLIDKWAWGIKQYGHQFESGTCWSHYLAHRRVRRHISRIHKTAGHVSPYRKQPNSLETM